jgi:hypothetical protein
MSTFVTDEHLQGLTPVHHSLWLTLCAPSEQAATGSSIRHQTLVSFRLRPPSVPILPNVLEVLPHEFSHVLQCGDPCVQDCRFSLCHAGCVVVQFAVLAHCAERKHAMEFSSVDLKFASVGAFERDATGLAGSPDVDLETPAVLAASDRLSMVSSSRCECHGTAVNGLRMGFLASGALAETLRRNGANFSAMPVSVAASDMASLLVAWCATATLPAMT